MLVLQEYLKLPHVVRAMASPMHAESALSFFLGVDYRDDESMERDLKQGACMEYMANLWWNGGEDYDAVCRDVFRDAVRAAGQDGWAVLQEKTAFQSPLTPIDVSMSQVVLCDQLSRNVFRGTAEAFEYEENALEAAATIADAFLDGDNGVTPLGTVYPPYLTFVVTAFMHSEELSHHITSKQVLALAKEVYGTESLKGQWELQTSMGQDHTDVIERFGRYPHRNGAKGRTSTDEEEAWLANVDELPAWAKSQMN